MAALATPLKRTSMVREVMRCNPAAALDSASPSNEIVALVDGKVAGCRNGSILVPSLDADWSALHASPCFRYADPRESARMAWMWSTCKASMLNMDGQKLGAYNYGQATFHGKNPPNILSQQDGADMTCALLMP
jgi:hypothetical protein